MPNNNETTTKFKVDISELKKGMQEAGRQIRLANSEFKAATSGLDNWSKSADGVTAKITQLNKTLDAQKKQLTNLEKQYELTVKQEGAASKGAQELLIRINNQKAAIGNTEKQINTYNSKLEELSKEAKSAETASEKLRKTISKQDTELKTLKQKYADVVLQQGKSSDAAKTLASKIDSLSSELSQNKKMLNEAEGAADELDKTFDDLGESAENSGDGFTVMKGALANLVAEGIQLAIGAIKNLATDVLEVGKNFDSSMSNVAALSGATGKELEMLESTAREFGATTQFSASEAADALGYMALAGWDANQSAESLGGVLNLAAASGMELAQASDMVTDYLSAFGLEAKDSAYFADMLSYAQANSNTTAEGLGEAFKNCAANMKAAGQDVETTTAFLGMLANQGLKGSEAGTALTAVMRDMTAKMKDGAIQIGQTSVQVQDAEGNYRDLTDILKDVETATQGMGDAEKASALQATFTSDSIKGLNLALAAGIDNTAAFEQELRASAGSAEEMSRIMNDNLEGDLKAMNSAYEEFGITLYQSVNSPLRDIVQTITSEVLPGFTDLVNGVDGASEKVGTSVGNLITNILHKIIDFLPQAVEIGLNLVKSLISGILDALPDVIRTLTETIRIIITSLGKFLPEIVTKFVKIFPEIADALYDAIPILLQAALDFFTTIVNAIPQIIPKILEAMPKVYQSIADALTDGIPTLVKGAKALLNAIVEALPMIVEQISSELPDIIKALVDLFVSSYPMIIDAAVELLMALIDAIPIIQDALIEQMPQLIMAIGTALIEAAPALLSAAKQVWSTLLKAIPTLLEGLVKIIWNTVTAIPGQIFPPVWDAIKGFFGEIGSFFEEFGAWIYDKIQERIELMKSIFGAIADWINDNVFQPIMDFFTPVIDFFETAFEIIAELGKGAWKLIKTVWSEADKWFNNNVITPISNFFSKLWNAISTTASNTWTAIKKVWNVVSTWFNEKIIQPVGKFFSNMWTGLKDGASDAWSGIKSVFGSVADWFEDKFRTAWQKVKDVFSTGGKIFDGIKEGITDAFKTVVNAIIRGLNKVIAIPFNAINKTLDKIRNVSIAGVEPFSGLISQFDVPQIPELAKGIGVAKKGHMYLLEGNGDEAVVPLEKNTGWLDEIAERLSNKMNISGQTMQQTINNNTVNNFNQTNNSPKSLSRLEIYRQSKNLLSMKGV